MKKFMSILHSFAVPVLSFIWTVAMINLWEWNCQYTGCWFAFAMVFLGVTTFFASLAHTFKWVDKIKERLSNKK